MKKIVLLTILLLSIISIINSFHTIYTLWQKQAILAQTKQRLENAKKENKMLKKELSDTSNQAFIEEEARDKLFMVKPGESTVLMAQDAPSLDVGNPVNKTIHAGSNWEQWVHLFFP